MKAMRYAKHSVIKVAHVCLLVYIISAMTQNTAIAKRIIYGKITDGWGRPASGFLVKAYDSDTDADDFMGQAITDSKGNYSIPPYTAKHWDKAPHNVTTWRPDIYVNVYGKINNKWKLIKKSGTYKNRKHKYDTRINLKLPGIRGYVHYENNTPASRILVKAFDDDDVLSGKRDFMCQGYTNAQGQYMLVYEGKHWDTAPHGVTKWRPDIYIEVHNNIKGRWIKMNRRSKKHNDVPHRNILTINEKIITKSDADYRIPAINDKSFNILTYNIFMRPEHVFPDGQSTRANEIAKQILKDSFDAIVFQEGFDDSIRKKIKGKLKSRYPYSTRTVGTEHDVIWQDGGVFIISKWPIENNVGEQRRFKKICSNDQDDDCKADKGVIYARINKNGGKFHVFGTHTDAGGTAKDINAREKQLRLIKKFIDEKIEKEEIKMGEPVFIAGDLNIDKYAKPEEYKEMKRILNAIHPHNIKYQYSSDHRVNDLSKHDGKRQLLDYVLLSRSTKVTMASSYNQVLFVRADHGWQNYKLKKFKYKEFWDISDHYPVLGRFELKSVSNLRKAIRKPTILKNKNVIKLPSSKFDNK